MVIKRWRQALAACGFLLAAGQADAQSSQSAYRGDYSGPPYGGVGGVQTSQIALQCHLPFIVPSSGTIGNNGALSGITALQTTYPAAYMYLPLNAVFSGSIAGWWYFVGSSTTAGTLYNNNYPGAGGNCYIPASPTPLVTTGPGAYTQTTAANLIGPHFTLPANVMGINGTLRFEGVENNNNSAGQKNIKGFLSSFTFSTASPTTTIINAIYGGFSNRAVANVQVPLMNNFTFQPSSSGSIPVYGAIDTTTQQNVGVMFTLNAVTDTMVMENVTITLLPGN